MREPRWWSLQAVRALDRAEVALVCTPSVRAWVQSALGLPSLTALEHVPQSATSLIVAGGGRLLDAAKVFRADERPDLQLIALPTIWGSGAEVTHIAVGREGDMKRARVDASLAPDGVLVLPELSARLPADLARAGQGDAWSHAYEAFLSPLAEPPLQAELGRVMGAMLQTGLTQDPAWFLHAARAGMLQQRASVGLVHGIAHSLEVPLGETDLPLGHAALCSLFLWPVHRFNRSKNETWSTRAAAHGLDVEAVEATLRSLHDPYRYRAVLPMLRERWKAILREPCSRTNSALVRRGDRSFFEAFA